MDKTFAVPTWLEPQPPSPTLSGRELARLKRENQRALYPALFERALEGIMQGKPLSQAVEEYPLAVDYSDMLAWIHRDEERRTRYYDAQAVGAEVVADEMIAISDASDSIEDVQRSTLRINTRKWLLGVWNRKRFGDVKQIEQNVTIDMVGAMNEARLRASRRDAIDVEVKS